MNTRCLPLLFLVLLVVVHLSSRESRAASTPSDKNFFGAFPTSINVMSYGAVGDGVADDTKAIQAAIDSAVEIEAQNRRRYGLYRGLAKGAKASAYPEVYFPDGKYRINETVLVQQSVHLRGSGKSVLIQSNPEKDLFYFHYAYRVGVEGLNFDGGKIQLKFWTGNLTAVRITISRCRFSNASASALECLSFTEKRLTGEEWNKSKPWPPYLVESVDGQWKLTPNQADDLKKWYNSTLVSVESSHFENCMRVATVVCDTMLMRDCSIVTHPEMEGAALDLGGQARVYDLRGKARVNPEKDQYWIKASGNFSLRGARLETDSEAGIGFIRSTVVPTATAPGVRVEETVVKTGGSRQPALVYIEDGTMPNILSIRKVEETSGKPVRAVAWESSPEIATLAPLRYFSGTPVEKQFRIVISENGSNVDAGVPDSLAALVEKPIASELHEKLMVQRLPVRRGPAGSGEWIDARDHGVDPASAEDQSTAIQALFDHAATRPDATVVFPGAATYTVSQTIRLPSSVEVTVAGVAFFIQSDPEKDLFRAEGARKIHFRNSYFMGGRHAFTIRSQPEDDCAVGFDSCTFSDQYAIAVECLSGEGNDEVANRTTLTMSNLIFNVPQAVVTNAAQSQISAFWAITDPHINDQAFIENRGGAMRVEAMLGNPRLWYGERSKRPETITHWSYSRNCRWVDNWGKFYGLDNRFGGESGGICNVFNRSPLGTVYINGGLTRFNNDASRKAILFLEKTPAMAALRDISSIPGRGRDPALARILNAAGEPMEEPYENIEASAVLIP